MITWKGFGITDMDVGAGLNLPLHVRGGFSGVAMTRNQLTNLIKKAGKVPVERDSFYNPVK